MKLFYTVERGLLDSFVLVVEGSIPNEKTASILLHRELWQFVCPSNYDIGEKLHFILLSATEVEGQTPEIFNHLEQS